MSKIIPLFAKVSFKAPASYKAKFNKSNCSVTISIGQESQEGDKFGATAALINRHFKSCTLMVCDSLQRHTYKINSSKPLDALHHEANLSGDNWINANSKYFELFDIPVNIIRWDAWLQHKNFKSKYSLINNLFKNELNYKNALMETAEVFSNRYQKRFMTSSINSDYLLSCSLDYLMEECAVMLLWADCGYDFEIYPSERIKAMKVTHDYFIPSNLLLPVSLEIRSRKIIKQ